MNRQEIMTNINNKKDPQKKHRFVKVSIFFTGGLKNVYGTNLTLISDVHHDK